jgi:hypothetical protein
MRSALVGLFVAALLLGACAGDSNESSDGAAARGDAPAEKTAKGERDARAAKRAARQRREARAARQRQEARERRARARRARARRARARRESEAAAAAALEAERKAAEEAAAAEQASDCDPNYAGGCLDPNSPDYDCEGGSGDGPDYTGTISVVGDDIHELDRDGDGTACDV